MMTKKRNTTEGTQSVLAHYLLLTVKEAPLKLDSKIRKTQRKVRLKAHHLLLTASNQKQFIYMCTRVVTALRRGKLTEGSLRKRKLVFKKLSKKWCQEKVSMCSPGISRPVLAS